MKINGSDCEQMFGCWDMSKPFSTSPIVLVGQVEFQYLGKSAGFFLDILNDNLILNMTAKLWRSILKNPTYDKFITIIS